jgi:hypothetical protein
MDSNSVEKAVMACFRVPEGKYKAAKVYAVREGLTMQEILSGMFLAWVHSKDLESEGKK